ncbi:hypothetical protein ABVT39_027239 [Epinephelus coioides]
MDEMTRGIIAVFRYTLWSLRDHVSRYEIRFRFEESDGLVVVLLLDGERLAMIFITNLVTRNPPDSAV